MEASKEKIKIIKLEDLPKQIGKEIHVNGEAIALFHLTNGEVQAIGSRCPHAGGPLAEGIVSGEFVFCPLHNRKISLVTGEVQEPDDGCVTTYETEVIDGYVHITV
ncbi:MULTISPECIES: nitrite reductase small subunit NirD [Oceanobacillus]|uniref:Nitrite reductase NAD(P)H small subunit n=1 Tax=Oceanobacillus neutriphilus TaxID=531815 RepID=A0ABQ2NZ66_9BACI|nr:nitrite reductase small subunit NirD [Oceanobacillus neutriphilus]GGP14198.1 nitrite reductase NAD(P)H small subunit [Oceanobacillus neutriphilus]